jgi:hypothetical protein
MKADYICFDDQDDLFAYVSGLSPKTVIFDVEPLVARWNTGPPELVKGLERWVGKISSIPGLAFVGFVTNSQRLGSVGDARNGAKSFYVASAHKPFQAEAYRGLPRPGAVVGDQLATDGIWAWRLGFDFVHYYPRQERRPVGVRAMNLLGRLLRPLFFRTATSPCRDSVPRRGGAGATANVTQGK